MLIVIVIFILFSLTDFSCFKLIVFIRVHSLRRVAVKICKFIFHYADYG